MMKKILALRNFRSIILPWAVVFLLLNLIVTQDGEQNAISRFSTMRSMLEQRTFSIDDRIGASPDWARTPDGHYYSNKAPGPMLLGFPVFFIVDELHRLQERGKVDEKGLRPYPGYMQKTLTSFLTQAIPFALLCGFVVNWLALAGISVAAQTFFLLAAFFANTAAVFMNSYFGHGFAALLTLAFIFFLLEGNFFWASFFAGSAMLSDYGFATTIPGLLLAVVLAWAARKKNVPLKRVLRDFLLGAIFPGILWIWYHTAAFGSPFRIANQFQNPLFQDTLSEAFQVWGIFRLPSWEIVYELLFGKVRGILFTQPWMFLSLFFGASAFVTKKWSLSRSVPIQVVASYSVLGFFGLLIMNASFGSWHGGGTPGPRYMSSVFPCLALLLALQYDLYPNWAKYVSWILLAISIAFRGLAYGSTFNVAPVPLWAFYWGELTKPSKTPMLRVFIFGLLLALAAHWQWKKRKTLVA